MPGGSGLPVPVLKRTPACWLHSAKRIGRVVVPTYGSPRLRRLGHHCSRKRVARLMRQAGLHGLPRRKCVRTTQRDATQAGVPDLLHRDFAAAVPNQKWVTDITYIPTDEGWLYLALVLDLFSRRVVGWAMEDHMEATLVVASLQMAYTQRGAPSSLIYHSDHGSQYTSTLVQVWLSARGLQASMGGVGDCFDNAVAESFFATLKRECVSRQAYATRAVARPHIFEYMEVFYNRQRLHSTLDYQSPAEYEQQAGGDYP